MTNWRASAKTLQEARDELAQLREERAAAKAALAMRIEELQRAIVHDTCCKLVNSPPCASDNALTDEQAERFAAALRQRL